MNARASIQGVSEGHRTQEEVIAGFAGRATYLDVGLALTLTLDMALSKRPMVKPRTFLQDNRS